MRDYGKGSVTPPSNGYGKSVKEGPTKAHSKTSQAFKGGGPAKKGGATTRSNNPDDRGMRGPDLNDTGFDSSPQPTMVYQGTPTASAFERWSGSPPVPDPNGFAYTRFDGPTPRPNPKAFNGMGGPLGPPVRGYPTAVANAKVTAPDYMGGGGQAPTRTTDASGFGTVRDDYGYGASAGHGFGAHDYGVGAQMTGFTGGDNFGFTDFNQSDSGGSSGGGGSTSGGSTGGGFGGSDQESKG